MPERDRTLRDPELGVLRFNPELDWWEGDLPGHPDAALYLDGVEEPDPAWLQQVRATVGAVGRSLTEAIDFAALQLLHEHNENWRTSSAAIGHDAFVAAVGVASVAVRANGTVQVYLDDGDLFDGNTIVVTLDRDLTPSEAGIASE